MPAKNSSARARRQDAVQVATDLYRVNPDWAIFYREILGVDGVVRKLFSTPKEYRKFQSSAEYAKIQLMLSQLRNSLPGSGVDKEPLKMITVRLPESLHASIREEAERMETSVNRLCITKLLQAISDDLLGELSDDEPTGSESVEGDEKDEKNEGAANL